MSQKSLETTVHPSAIIEPGAQIDPGVLIGAYCVIGPEVSIGAGTVLENHVVIVGSTTVGRNNVIGHHAVIGGPPQLLKDLGPDTGIVIGDDNILRECVTVNTGTTKGGGPTRIGNHCLLMIAAHVAHDCILGDYVELINNVLLAGHIRVEDRAIISGGAALHHFVSVGTLAFVGGLSRIVQDVPPYMLVEGNPSRVRGVNVVGLRRAGVTEENISALKVAHRLLYRRNLSRNQALKRLEAQPLTPEVRHLVDFLHATAQGKQGRAREVLRSP